MEIERRIFRDGKRLVRDFSNCKIDFTINYNGANGKKACILYEGDQYMLKTSGYAKNNPLMTYSNSCISEYVCCNIIDKLGYDVQKTLLGKFQGKLVVACKDFRENGKYTFCDFASLKNNIVFSSTSGADTELSEVLSTINEQNLIEPEQFREFFWDQFVLDAYLGNFDRHNGNWGYLYDNNTGLCKPAPIFDCGSCLYPQLAVEQMENILLDESKVNERVYIFPNSALKFNGKKINYYEFLSTTDNEDCLKSLKKFSERFELKIIKDVLNSTPILSSVHKEFITKILKSRNDKLITYALKNNKNLSKGVFVEKLSTLGKIKAYQENINKLDNSQGSFKSRSQGLGIERD